MYILGISCYYHDAAACLLENGRVVAAAEEERFTRIKHDSSFPRNAINFCLEYANIQTRDIDYVVFNEKPFLKFERITKTILATYPLSGGLFQEAAINWMGDKLWIKSLIEEEIGIDREKILFSQHHLSHAAGSLFCSNFREAAVVTCDGVGEWETTAVGFGKAGWQAGEKNEIQLLEEIRFPHSLGLLYSAFTSFLGFKVNDGEYKVMGMAAFGKPRYTDKVYQLINVAEDGSFRLNMQYFSFHYHTKKSINRRFEKLFGRSRNADIAASIQKVTEDVLIKICNHAYLKTGFKKLCFSGGVALNCVANSRILRETPFEEMFIQPAAGDSGAAMGAALFVWHCLLGEPRSFVLNHAFWGKEYSDAEVESFLKSKRTGYEHIKDRDKLLDLVAQAIADGKVIGWLQGRFEWGPRALGNRSILADPRDNLMKDIINIKIKFREPFRPFAPAVLSEKAEDFFEFDKTRNQSPLRFMLYTLPVKKKELIPAVTHVDGSSRPQVVDKETSPLFYSLIEKFYHLTGMPVLLNTSFNLKDEPIVNSPQDAFNTFTKSGIDMLVLNNFIIKK